MPTKNKKVRQLAGAQNLIPPRKTAGWRYAPPEKKPPEWAAISVILPFWCGEEDLNLHEHNAQQPLKLTRLPIPPPPHST